MRQIKIAQIILIAFFLIKCNTKNQENNSSIENKSIENKPLNKIKDKNSEIFILEKPLNITKEPFYKTIYKDYTVLIMGNSQYQELSFFKNGKEIKKVLNLYYENPLIVFHLYKSNVGNLILIIEGQDYYGSNLGVYFIAKNSNEVIEIDDTLNYNQDDPESLGFKNPNVDIIKKENNLVCDFYLGDKFLYSKEYNIMDKIKNKPNSKIYPSDLRGMWYPDCKWGNELWIREEDGKANFPIHELNNIHIYANIKKTSNPNEHILTFDSFSHFDDIKYPNYIHLEEDEISKEEIIAKLYLQDNGDLEFHWIGLYNTKTKKLEVTGNQNLYVDWNKGKNPVMLKTCK